MTSCMRRTGVRLILAASLLLVPGLAAAQAPTISFLSQSSGSSSGGTRIAIFGTNFVTGGGTTVRFGSTTLPSNSLQVSSTTQINVVTPAAPAGAVTVTVTTSGGSVTTSFVYADGTDPAVTSVAPTRGSMVGGTTVTIKGAAFSATPIVTFGSVSATNVTLVDSSTITAVTPVAYGQVPIVVTNPSTLSATLLNAFTFVALCDSPSTSDAVTVDCVQTLKVDGGPAPAGITPRVAKAETMYQLSVVDDNNLPRPNDVELNRMLTSASVITATVSIGSFVPQGAASTGFINSWSFDQAAKTASVSVKPRATSWSTATPCTPTACSNQSDVDYGALVLTAFQSIVAPPGPVDPFFNTFKDAFKGTIISSNAQYFSVPSFDVSAGALAFTVGSPHLRKDGTLNRGFLHMFLPDGFMSAAFGITDPSKVTAAMSKITIGGSSVTPTLTRQAAGSGSPAGLLVDIPDFGYSVPDVKVKFAAVSAARAAADADADGKADLMVFRPSNGTWFTKTSTTGYVGFTSQQFGLPGDVPVPGDYDGDGRMDQAVYRPSTGIWFVTRSSSGIVSTYTLGGGKDLAVPGDYDADGRTDVAMYRPSTGVWSVLTSSSGYATTVKYAVGVRGDIPVPADYDGDGKTDPATYRAATGMWYELLSSGGALRSTQFGLTGDIPVPGDYDGDGVADNAVFRPSTGQWFLLLSTTSFSSYAVYQWGLPGDTPVPADYDGDGKTDLALFRSSTGMWFLNPSGTGYSAASAVSYQWGLASDVPGPGAPVTSAVAAAAKPGVLANLVQYGDFDADAKSDLAVFRPSIGAWFVRLSGTPLTGWTFPLGVATDQPVTGDFDGDGRTDAGTFTPATGIWTLQQSTSGPASYQWGLAGDQPAPGDFDGDGRTDIAVFRPTTGEWFVRTSSSNFVSTVYYQWGLNGDLEVPGDYDGDGITDLAVFRPGTAIWFIRTSSSGFVSSVSYQWGLGGDVPVPGDYDGDGKSDVAVFRPLTGTWFIRTSSSSFVSSVSYQWGLAEDVPVPGEFDGDGKTDIAVYRPSIGTWFVLQSSTGFTIPSSQQWGLSTDTPLPEN